MKVSVEESTIVCDNPACGFEQAIPFEDREKWIDRPCPNCGENLITREDFEKSQALYDLLNNPLWAELEEKAINSGLEPQNCEIMIRQQRDDDGADSLTIRIKKEAENDV
jgi:hypothetical protein